MVTTYDAAPSGGSFGGAKQLAVRFHNAQRTHGKTNTIGLTLGGVVATAGVTLTNASIPVIDTASQSITISAKDADGNTIVGGWFDATGNAVTMNLSSNAPSVRNSRRHPTSLRLRADLATHVRLFRSNVHASARRIRREHHRDAEQRRRRPPDRPA